MSYNNYFNPYLNYTIPVYPVKSTKAYSQASYPNNNQVFFQPASTNGTMQAYPQPYYTNYSQIDNLQKTCPAFILPQVKDPSLQFALSKLAEITHDPRDVEYLKSYGINLPFNNGQEALNFVRDNNITVEYIDMGEDKIHAQYSNRENKIQINQKYKNQMTEPVALAIADAIYHEVGHAKDRDEHSSIQEEIECLALNVLGYRFQQRKYPQIMASQENSKLLSDGVALYPKLFFDNDPYKKALINRLSDKYGELPKVSPNHPNISYIADKSKQQFFKEHSFTLNA